MFRTFAEWVATTQLSQLFQAQSWVVPTSQSIHIVCIGLVFTAAITINLRILGAWGSGRSIVQLTTTLVPWMRGALCILLVTGIIQIIAEPVRQFVTPVFWAKMILILVVAVATSIFASSVRSNGPRWDAGGYRSRSARAFAVVSSFLWVAIIVCGRFIGYTYSFYV